MCRHDKLPSDPLCPGPAQVVCQREALMIDQKRQGYSDAFLRDPTLTPSQLDVDATCC